MIKAVFFDIDGTLVSFKTHTVPPSTIRAIEALKAQGIKTFIATGRAFTQIPPLEGIKFDGYVTVNGGYCLTAQKEVMYKNPIPQSDVEALVRYQLEVEEFPCLFVSENEVFLNKYNDDVEKIEKMLHINFNNVKPLEYALGQEIFQLVAFFGEDKEKEMMQKIFSHCEATRWYPLFTDIIATGNSKQVGIDKVLEYYDLDLSECMSFGDGGNDISMLQHTPISVAMGNASDEVKSYATHVTDSVDEDGIWNMLKKLEII